MKHVWIIALLATVVPCIGAFAESREGTTRMPHDAASMDASSMQIYRAEATGTELYAQGDYAAAYPHLLVAAQHGFKYAQAQLGYMHLNGLGEVERNSRIGVGWLGVAAFGSTDPKIKEYYEAKWEQIPREYVGDFTKIVDAFVAHYGSEAHGVSCRRERKTGTSLKVLVCRFTDRRYGDILDDPYVALEQPLGDPPPKRPAFSTEQ